MAEQSNTTQSGPNGVPVIANLTASVISSQTTDFSYKIVSVDNTTNKISVAEALFGSAVGVASYNVIALSASSILISPFTSVFVATESPAAVSGAIFALSTSNLATQTGPLVYSAGGSFASGTTIKVTPVTLGPQPVFRFFDTHDGGHFFTTSTAERDQVLATRKDLNFEGVGYDAVDPASNDPNAAPVYRFFDTHDGGHFFTTSAAERDQVLATRKDLNFEGVGYSEHTTRTGW